MIRNLAVLLLLGGCQDLPNLIESPPDAPSVTMEAAPKPLAEVLPTKLRAALDQAAPQERALAASPHSDAGDVALMITLHRNVVDALAELERDGGRHVTPAAVTRARTAVRDLENHLAEFKASQ